MEDYLSDEMPEELVSEESEDSGIIELSSDEEPVEVSPPRRRRSRDSSPVRSRGAFGPKSKQWCFTWNNYDMDDVYKLQALHTVRNNKVDYCIFQPEVGKNGTKHLQGYISFSVRKQLSTMKRLLGETVHLEVPKGTPEQNKKYCSKDDTRDSDAGFGIHEVGELPTDLGQGKRNDLLAITKRIDEGEHFWTILKEDESARSTGLRNSRSLSQYEQHTSAGRQSPTALHIYEGDPGTFKSWSAFQWPDGYTLEHGNSGAWFDGYEPNKHKTIVVDEFSGASMPFTTLKKLADRYPMAVETKGGRVTFRARRIVITSNIIPEQWYSKYPFDSIDRRITSWFSFAKIQAPIHGLNTGSILITKKRGKWTHLPLFPHLVDVPGQPDKKTLTSDFLEEHFHLPEDDDSEAIWQ